MRKTFSVLILMILALNPGNVFPAPDTEIPFVGRDAFENIGKLLALKEQDKDTRQACAEAVLKMDEPLDSSAAPSIAHDIFD